MTLILQSFLAAGLAPGQFLLAMLPEMLATCCFLAVFVGAVRRFGASRSRPETLMVVGSAMLAGLGILWIAGALMNYKYSLTYDADVWYARVDWGYLRNILGFMGLSVFAIGFVWGAFAKSTPPGPPPPPRR